MNEKDLSSKACIPCSGGVPALKGKELSDILAKLGNDWEVVDEHHLEKIYTFRNFREALTFTNKAGEVAEAEGHHPSILLEWGKVTVTVWTHKIDGLTESDFILAAKIDRIFESE